MEFWTDLYWILCWWSSGWYHPRSVSYVKYDCAIHSLAFLLASVLCIHLMMVLFPDDGDIPWWWCIGAMQNLITACQSHRLVAFADNSLKHWVSFTPPIAFTGTSKQGTSCSVQMDQFDSVCMYVCMCSRGVMWPDHVMTSSWFWSIY